jgi:peptidyl-dipeptidase A
MRRLVFSCSVVALAGSLGCRGTTTPSPTAADARAFLGTVNDTMKRLGVEQNQSGWVQQNFITDDTEALAARVNQRYIDAVARFAKEATKFTTRWRSPLTSGVS